MITLTFQEKEFDKNTLELVADAGADKPFVSYNEDFIRMASAADMLLLGGVVIPDGYYRVAVVTLVFRDRASLDKTKAVMSSDISELNSVTLQSGVAAAVLHNSF